MRRRLSRRRRQCDSGEAGRRLRGDSSARRGGGGDGGAIGGVRGAVRQQPKISTGAGDHFNAGFCLGRVLGLGLEESLCAGVATSGYYVRNAQSPTGKQLADFIAKLPPPQG